MQLLNLFALFITIAGYVVGLGSVTVIEFHAWLGRHSSYWKEATTRTHKITKPLIWIGLMQAIGGSAVLYAPVGFTPLVTTQLLIGVLLVLNGLYLSVQISPILLKQEQSGHCTDLLPETLQRRIGMSFALSYVAWWSSLMLFSFHIAGLR